MSPIAAIIKRYPADGTFSWKSYYGTLIAIGNAGEMYATVLEPDEIVVHVSNRLLRGFKHEVGGDIPYEHSVYPTPHYFEPEMDTLGT